MHVDEQGGSLDPDEPQSFVYDEWDFRADDIFPLGGKAGPLPLDP